MPKRPRVFLLDAGPVIKLFQLGLWDPVVERAEIIVPSIVAGESQFAVVGDRRIEINLETDVTSGRIRQVECSRGEVDRALNALDASIRDSIHAGEAEALAILHHWKGELPRLCLADQLATIGLCLLGYAECAISFEKLLEELGLGRSMSPRWFTEECMQDWLTEGRRRRVTGEGLASNPHGREEDECS